MLKWLWLAVAVLGLDQLTKSIAEHQLVQFAPVEVLPFFNLSLVYNTGAAFSLLGEAGGWQRWLFIALALGVSVVLVVWMRRLGTGEHLTAVALALVLGGALGNVIDRIWHGHVIDFIDLHYAGYHWPAFNLADSAITVGAVLLIATSLLPEPPSRPRRNANPDDPAP